MRYRISIEKGMHPETTEVHVREVELPIDAPPVEDFSWPETSDNPEREKWLTDELAKVLAEGVTNNAASLMGQNVGGNEKVGYSTIEGEPAIYVQLPYVRARSSVAYALKSEGFVTWEHDAEEKIFYFGYLPPSYNKGGFFRWFAFWKSDVTLPEKAEHTLAELLANLKDSPAVRRVFSDIKGSQFTSGQEAEEHRYLLLMSTRKEGSKEIQEIIVRDEHGAELPVKTAKTLLRTIRANLL